MFFFVEYLDGLRESLLFQGTQWAFWGTPRAIRETQGTVRETRSTFRETRQLVGTIQTEQNGAAKNSGSVRYFLFI
ncbi:hypothetical protein AU377_04285 [Sporosarcina sp. HYO08]|nr:hypothetical protein AU377_04285 [Sporosarcina sp. HYO08]